MGQCDSRGRFGKKVLPGVTGQPRVARASDIFRDFPSVAQRGKLTIHERYRMARFTTLDGASR